MRSYQNGVGMIEILVSLLILAIGILGFSLLQMRAIEASYEAMSKLQAMNIARDLSEKIRTNPKDYQYYQVKINENNQVLDAKPCIQQGNAIPCNHNMDYVDYDVAQTLKSANGLGMTIKMPSCFSNNKVTSRRCIYVAWGKTKAIDDFSADDACTYGGSYLPKAQCIVMEVY